MVDVTIERKFDQNLTIILILKVDVTALLLLFYVPFVPYVNMQILFDSLFIRSSAHTTIRIDR